MLSIQHKCISNDSKFKINSFNKGVTATDLNNHNGKQASKFVAQIIVNCGTLKEDEPSEKFLVKKDYCLDKKYAC